MAPEQLRGEEVSHAWDVWAMAVIAYEMLVGRLPFSGFAFVGGLDSLPGGHESAMLAPLATAPRTWHAFFTRALSPDPAGRPASASGLMAELEQILPASPRA
jgi:serine/threonine protein kinase